jgi:hypothetical protein
MKRLVVAALAVGLLSLTGLGCSKDKSEVKKSTETPSGKVQEKSTTDKKEPK